VFLAPLDIAKLPNPWFVGIVSALIPGFVFLAVVGYLRWDLVIAYQKTPVFSEGVSIAIFVLAAFVSGMLIGFICVLLIVFYYAGYAIGYLLSRQIPQRRSRNMLWRRMVISFVGNQLVRLEEPALSEEDFKAEMEKVAKTITPGTPQEKILEALAKPAGTWAYRGQVDEEWTQMYRVLESYFHQNNENALIMAGLLQSVGLAVACALVLFRTPHQSPLIIVAVLVTAAGTLFLALVGVSDGCAYPGEIFQLPKMLREIKSASQK
jgi:hypothetical protein